jgi:CHAT domain-containing protein
MVVLSACNSGSGKLYNGEGIVSLARGFILAGASSVVRTKWEINDESSSSIIERFYYYLSKGNPKDVSMRLAKLDFIKSNSPFYSNPYFWAGYEVLGDNSRIITRKKLLSLKISALIIVISFFIYYFNRRRIFSARGR